MLHIRMFSITFRNIFTGMILDSLGYFILEVFFICCLEIALLAGGGLYLYNSYTNGPLNDRPSIRDAKLKAQKSARKNASSSAEINN